MPPRRYTHVKCAVAAKSSCNSPERADVQSSRVLQSKGATKRKVQSARKAVPHISAGVAKFSPTLNEISTELELKKKLLYKARVEKSELEEQLTIAKNCEAHLEADLNAFKDFLQKELVCCLCCKQMQMPWTLIPCGHTFCVCITDILDKGSRHCPFCFQDVEYDPVVVFCVKNIAEKADEVLRSISCSDPFDRMKREILWGLYEFGVENGDDN